MPGAPVVKPSVGSASSTSGTATTQAARAGLRSAGRAARRRVERPLPGAAADRPALIRSPSRASSGGTATVETATLITVTTATAVASESSSEPGCRKAEKTTATNRVTPAKRVVRPALARVAAAASRGPRPRASSSRKRETISSE